MPKVVVNKENISLCSCPNCPSYNDCSKKKKEGIFCGSGKSSCAYKMNGCVCGSCLLHKKYNLQEGYYCIKGKAEEVDKKK